MVAVSGLAAVGQCRRAEDIENRHNGDGVREDRLDAAAYGHCPHHTSEVDAWSGKSGQRIVRAEGLWSIDNMIVFS